MDVLLDSQMVLVMLLVMGATAVTGGLGLLLHFFLADAIPNLDPRHAFIGVLMVAVYGGLTYVAFGLL